MTATGSRWFMLASLLLIVTLAFVGYLNADHEAFYFDSLANRIDTVVITRGLGQIASSLWQRPYLPGSSLTYVTFWMNYVLNDRLGLEPFDVTTFLIVNVLIHVLNTCLLFLFIRAMLRQVQPDGPPSLWVPLVVSMLFAVHPMHASSVVYIIQRRGLMVTAFFLLAMLAYLKARRPVGRAVPAGAAPAGQSAGGVPKARIWSPQRVLWFGAVLLCWWLAAKSKPMGMTLPIVVLAVELALRAPDTQSLRRSFRYIVPGAVAMLLVMFGYLWYRGLFDIRSFRILPWGEEASWGAWAHFLTESRAFVHYWKLLILPLPMWSTIDHDFDVSYGLLDHGAVVAVLFHGLLLGLAVVAARRRYVLAAAGIAWFYVVLIPYILLPQVALLVEYKTYLPAVGLALILAELIWRIQNRVPLLAQAVVVCMLTTALLATTVNRNVIYQSNINLWQDAVKKSPRKPRVHTALGNAWFDQGRYTEAIRCYREAIRLGATSSKPFNNLASSLIELDRVDEARQVCMELLKTNPEDAPAMANVGATYLLQGSLDEAIDWFRKALDVDEDDGQTHLNLGIALVQRREVDEGLAHLQRAKALLPSSAEVCNNLGNVYLVMNEAQSAIAEFRRAIELDPRYAEAHNNLGLALGRQGDLDNAIRHYLTAISIRPGYVDALMNLGHAFSFQNRPEKAIRVYEQVLNIDRNHRRARERLEALKSAADQ